MDGKAGKDLSAHAKKARQKAGGGATRPKAAAAVRPKKQKGDDEFLRLSEFNKAIISHSPVAIFTLDKDGVFTSVNPALGVISGLGQNAGKKLIGFNWLRNSYTIKSGLAAHITRALAGEPFQLWDFPFITYEGDSNNFIDFKGVPLKAKDGTIEGLLCMIEETTERVETRARLMQEARKSAVGRLAAGIAHELNNPLATLVAHVELAVNCLKSLEASTADKTLIDELRDYLSVIETQAFRCKDVTGSILSLPWKEGLEITDIDINGLLDSIVDSADTGKSEARILREFSPLPNVRGNVRLSAPGLFEPYQQRVRRSRGKDGRNRARDDFRPGRRGDRPRPRQRQRRPGRHAE